MKNLITMSMLITACLCLSLQTFVRAKIAETEDVENRPINFYMNDADEQIVRNTIICRGWPCPKFTVKEDHTRFLQERLYTSMDIVSATASECLNFTTALSEGYAKLFRYRRGNNSQHLNIAMSVPVVVKVKTDTSEECNSTYTIWFFINATTLTDGIPEPIEEKMQVEKIDELDVFVRTNGGFISDPQKQLDKLLDDIKALQEFCVTPDYMVAMYDTPWKKHGRRNEIWVERTKCSKEFKDQRKG